MKKRENEKLLTIISKNNLDVVVIQEQTRFMNSGTHENSMKPIMVAKSLENFRDSLFDKSKSFYGKYVFLDSRYKTGQSNLESNSSASELYCILFNPFVIDVDSALSTFIERDLVSKVFARVPYCFHCKFMAGAESLNCNLISVHLIPEKSRANERKKEFESICDFIKKNLLNIKKSKFQH